MAVTESARATGSVLAALDEMDLRALSRALSDHLRERQVTFGTADDGETESFVVDPVPRLIGRDEWDALAAGLAQRAEALDRFVADVYGERRIVSAGLVPWSTIASAEFYEPRLVELPPAPVRWITIAGLDLVRDGEGPFVVLEDNVRTPSGIAYAVAAREALSGYLSVPEGIRVRSLEPAYALLGEALRGAAAPDAGEQPVIVVLTDGPSNSAFYEHSAIARRLGLPLVAIGELSVRAKRLYARTDGRLLAVDVVYRRTNEDCLFDAAGARTTLADVLLGPLEAQTLACVNAFGTGVADDKLVHAYVEEMVRFYLGEEPLLASVPTHDPSQPGVLAMVLERLGELVIKPRSGHGGVGVVVGPRADEDALATVSQQLTATPERFVAQETIRLSRQPTVCGDELEPRHVDLRPFTFATGENIQVFPGGLTRVALERGSLVVNSSQNGGAKDTWVLA
ncbi:MAG: circularly permuted type 2 ATP-grasp protein [Solirubrobacteraceae bacterium]